VDGPVTTTVTREEIFGLEFRGAIHLNMGAKGYGWIFECERWPRLRIMWRHFKPTRAEPDGRDVQTYMVDGLEVADLDAAVAALNQPVQLTPEEEAAWRLVPAEFEDLRRVEDDLAGAERPRGAIMPDTPHSRVMHLLDALREKGAVELGKRPWPADYKPENKIEHLRWSPTIRRVPM
jgi:hypothetical protein